MCYTEEGNFREPPMAPEKRNQYIQINFNSLQRIYTISLPKGFRAIAVSLKCCSPKGIPIIVKQRSNPKTAWVRAIHIPPQISHNTFIRIYKHPEARTSTRVSRPKGHIASAPSLSVCMPKGMPMIVSIRTMLPIIYSIAIIIPPKMSQIRFPIMFMAVYLFQDDCFIFRIFHRICEDYLFCFLRLDKEVPFNFACLPVMASSGQFDSLDGYSAV